MENKIQKAVAYSKSHQNDFIQSLNDFLRIMTISSDAKYTSELEKGADWLLDYLLSLGATDTKLLKTSRYPVVYGQMNQAGPGKPTILIYGHYDVQPPDPIDEWDQDPFKPIIKDNVLYARGSSDMKGQIMVTLAAIQSILSFDPMPVNLKFFFEGEEEIGSPSIRPLLEKNKDLFKSDFVLNLDAGMIARDRPTIVYGLRGLAYFEISVTGPAHDLHSGMFGGVVLNPIHALCKMIAGMKDNSGRIQLPGFYEDVLPLDESERAALNELENPDSYYIEQTGAKEIFGEAGYSNVERIGARPTLDVNGIWGGYTGKGPKTVIPAKASAKLSMRLVPHQTPANVMHQLNQYLRVNAPQQISWDLKQLASDPACITEMDFYATRCLSQSLEKIWGKKPVFKREGGSIPIVSYFQSILGIESVLSGFSLPGDRVHSPNERFNLDLFERGIETVIDFFYRIAMECGK